MDSDGVPADVDRRIGVAWRELRRGASMNTLRALLYGEGDAALDLGLVDGLDLLAQAGATSMTELADVLRVDRSTATRAVDRLVESGLAERRRSLGDARVVEVVLTADGHRRHDALLARRRDAMAHILAGFSDDERRTLADLLERLVAGVDRFVEWASSPDAPAPSG